jgi:hypothetical protein
MGYRRVQSFDKRRALTAAMLAAALLCLQTVRADIVQDLADAVAAEGDAVATAKDLRPIPENAVEGVMFPPDGRLVLIDDTVMRLAPGSRIRDLRGRIVLPSTITEPVNVRYTKDLYSHVHFIWLMPGEVELEEKDESDSGDN